MVDLWKRDYFNQRMGDAIEVQQAGRWRMVDCFRRVLFQLDLLNTHSDRFSIFSGNAIVVVYDDAAVPGKRLCAIYQPA